MESKLFRLLRVRVAVADAGAITAGAVDNHVRIFVVVEKMLAKTDLHLRKKKTTELQLDCNFIHTYHSI